jgi:methyl-accepting chemotaxis protein/methyl-accepting chemotaxis protein-1 (serine sensor receptor)
MRLTSLTIGAKMALGTGALTLALALTAWLGLRTIGVMGAAFDAAANRAQAMEKDAAQWDALQRTARDADAAAAGQERSTARALLLLLMALGAGAAAASAAALRSATVELRRFAERLAEGSQQVASASGQVASASQALAQGSSEQAASLEETSSSAAEITAITRKNAESTRAAADLMTEAAQLVGEANGNLDEMVRSMKDINGSSEKIAKIIKVIDEIAFQTNILALNAAVEAARAGEAGMGFAVVADEVRNLAQRSAQAAKDTADLIEESIGKSKDGGRKLDLVAQSIRRITGSASQVKTLVDQIDQGSQEQSRGIEKIGGAVGLMEQVTQRNAANAEESAAAAQELSSQAEALRGIAGELRRVVGGKKGCEPGRSPQRTGAGPRPVHSAPAAVSARAAFPLDEGEGGF